MQGYVNQSPVKQVWLPIEEEFINQWEDYKFGEFAKAYLEKYGIDLHDIFKLNYDESIEEFGIGLKVDIVSCYVVDHFYDKEKFKSKLATFEGVQYATFSTEQGASNKSLVYVAINNNASVGWGFEIVLPATGIVVESIDDLLIASHEI